MWQACELGQSKNPFNLTAQKIDETLGSVDKKGMILHGPSQGKKSV